ncbi:MAG TPA: CheR family methyltransferase [Candidatus Dormibacteraeota bacterium]
MTREPIAVAGALLKSRAGLKADPTVRARLARCLDDGAARHGLSLDAYLELVAVDEEAFQELLDRVTVQHSYFFRDPNQFLALTELLAAAAPGPGMIWSAASGNGQEAYSLAMLLAECGRADWRILATDVSDPALGRARAGHYSTAEVKGVSAARMRRHFTRSGDGWAVAQALRARVDVVRHNLSAVRSPLPGASFSIIFCRNVLIYFDQAGVDACIGRLGACLQPGGHLFLGFSERFDAGSHGFDLVRLADAFAYRRQGAAPPAARGRTSVRAATTRPARQDQVAVPLQLLAEGERAFAAGDRAGAIRAFRRAVYLDPDEPVGYFQLGTALEHSGDRREARRAFAAAGAALARSDPSAKLAGLEGYSSAELGRAIAAKLGSQHMSDVN